MRIKKLDRSKQRSLNDATGAVGDAGGATPFVPGMVPGERTSMIDYLLENHCGS